MLTPGTGRSAHDATQHWPRVPRQQRQRSEAPGQTRLDLGAYSTGDAVSEPTRPVPVVRPVPPGAVESARRARGADTARQVVQQLAAAPPRPAWRARGPRWTRGLFGWVPTAPPSLAEAAQARVRVAEEEERRKLRHLRHLDVLEMVRAYITTLAACLLLLFLGGACVLALGILHGDFVWMPVVHR
jgi:hypothetical protein